MGLDIAESDPSEAFLKSVVLNAVSDAHVRPTWLGPAGWQRASAKRTFRDRRRTNAGTTVDVGYGDGNAH